MNYRKIVPLVVIILLLSILLATVFHNADAYIVVTLNRHRIAFWDMIFLTLSYSAPIITYTGATICVLLLYPTTRPIRQKLLILIISVALSGILPKIIKPLIRRPRPFEYFSLIHPLGPANGWSFPSGHTCDAFVFAATIALLVGHNRLLAIAVYLWAIMVGLSRIYLGVHFLSDVLAGAALSTAAALFTHFIITYFFKKEL